MWFFSLLNWLFKSMPFNFHKFVYFPLLLLLLTSNLIPVVREDPLYEDTVYIWGYNVCMYVSFVWDLSFKDLCFEIYLNLICGLTYDLSWRMSSVHLRRMCILLLLGRLLCIWLLDPVGFVLSRLFTYLSSIWLFYPL